jgi:predicted metal-dependent peptidase
MTHTKKIEKAKAKLMLEHPYIGSAATILELDNDTEALTFRSDGISLKYNDEYFEKAPVDEIEFALANGAMHAVLKHSERVNVRVGRIWQAAIDLVVNSMLVKNGFALPPYVYYDERFEGMYAEEIYDVLKDEMIINDTLDEAEAVSEDEFSESASENDSGEGDRQKESADTTPKSASAKEYETVEADMLSEELKEFFEQIFQKHKRQGNLPKDLNVVVPEYFSHKVDWCEILYRYIASYAKSTYSFVPPNMKYLYRGIYLPSLSSDLLRIVIAIDTSGSIDEELLGIFLGEVASIMQSYPNYEIDLITADAKVQSHKVFLPGEALEYEVSGGGGTDFRPVFEYIDNYIDYPTLLLYFTDGQGTFPQSEPGYDVLWLMPASLDVPFGEVLLIEAHQ